MRRQAKRRASNGSRRRSCRRKRCVGDRCKSARRLFRDYTGMTQPDSTRKLYELLHGFSTAMLITHSGGRLRARPMAIASLTESCELWFITGQDSAKAHEIERDTRVNVVCQEDHSAYIALE